MKIIDSHVHLYDVDKPLEMLQEAYQQGVSEVLLLGVDLASNQKHFKINSDIKKESIAQYPYVHLAFGIHPAYVKRAEENQECLTWIHQHINQAVAVGETGLDYSYAHLKNDPKAQRQQRIVFQQHLDLSVEKDLPIVIHSRQAWQDCFEMTKKSCVKKAHFHWYTGPADILKRIIDEGWTVSFSVVVEYQQPIQQLALATPLESILIETDTPVAYPLAGKEGRGKRFPSQPQDVYRTLNALAGLKQQPIKKVLEAVNANAKRLFGK